MVAERPGEALQLGDVAFATYYYRLYLKRSPAATDAADDPKRVV